jgi:hypothetical protein
MHLKCIIARRRITYTCGYPLLWPIPIIFPKKLPFKGGGTTDFVFQNLPDNQGGIGGPVNARIL